MVVRHRFNLVHPLLIVTIWSFVMTVVAGRSSLPETGSLTFSIPSGSVPDGNSATESRSMSEVAPRVAEVPVIQSSYPLSSTSTARVRYPAQSGQRQQVLSAGPTYIGIFPNLVGNDPQGMMPCLACPAPTPCEICPTNTNYSCGTCPACPEPQPCQITCPVLTTTTPSTTTTTTSSAGMELPSGSSPAVEPASSADSATGIVPAAMIVPSITPVSTLNETITVCGTKTSGEATLISSAPRGTISLYLSASNYVLCYYKLVANYPNTKLKILCSSIPGDTFVTLHPVTPATNTVHLNTEYTSTSNYVNVYITNEEMSGPLRCSWASVP